MYETEVIGSVRLNKTRESVILYFNDGKICKISLNSLKNLVEEKKTHATVCRYVLKIGNKTL